MKTAVLLLTLLLSATAFAANGKTVSYKSGDETVHGVLYTPRGKGPFPALVVIHEYWGLVPWVKEQAAKLADQGYVTLAVDLYRAVLRVSPSSEKAALGYAIAVFASGRHDLDKGALEGLAGMGISDEDYARLTSVMPHDYQQMFEKRTEE